LIVADRLHGIRLGESDVCRSGTATEVRRLDYQFV
jgi:hypothetical protein